MACAERWLLVVSLLSASASAIAGKSSKSDVEDTPEAFEVDESRPVAFPPLAVYLPASLPFVGGQGQGHGDRQRASSHRPKQRDKYNHSSIPYLPSLFNQGSAPYSYEYNVRDDHKGTLFGHREAGKGSNAEGRYYVHLPDGRVQLVRYYTNDDGFHSEVDYVGSNDHNTGDYGHGKGFLGGTNGNRRIPLVDQLSQQIFGLEREAMSTTPTPKHRPLPSRDYSNPEGLIKRLRESFSTKAPVTLESNKPEVLPSYSPLPTKRPVYPLNVPLSLLQSVHASQSPVNQYQAPGAIYLNSIPSAVDFESAKSMKTIPTHSSTTSRVPVPHNTDLPRASGIPTPTQNLFTTTSTHTIKVEPPTLLYGIPVASYLPPPTTSSKHVGPQSLYDLPATTHKPTTMTPNTVCKTLEITGPHPDEIRVLNIEELDKMALETFTEPIPVAQDFDYLGDPPPHFNTNLSFDISNILFRDVAEAADLEPGPRGQYI